MFKSVNGELIEMTSEEIAAFEAERSSISKNIAKARVIQNAKSELASSDLVVIRCYEHGVVVPSDWIAYRQAHRDMISGKDVVIPPRPAYPVGT